MRIHHTLHHHVTDTAVEAGDQILFTEHLQAGEAGDQILAAKTIQSYTIITMLQPKYTPLMCTHTCLLSPITYAFIYVA